MDTHSASERAAAEAADADAGLDARVGVDARAHPEALRALKRKGALFVRALGVEVERAVRYRRPLAMLLLRARRAPRSHMSLWDSQRRVLFAELLERAGDVLRTPDFVARVSDRDFAICLPETDAAGAAVVARKLLGDPRIEALLARVGSGVAGVDPVIVEHVGGDTTAEVYLARALRVAEHSGAPLDGDPPVDTGPAAA